MPAAFSAVCLLLCGCTTEQIATTVSTAVSPPKSVNTTPAVTPGSLIFTQVAATTTTQTVAVVTHNLDALTATIVSGADFHLTQVVSCAQGAPVCHIAVTFSPLQPETVTGSLLLTDTLTGLTATVTLAGTGTAVPPPVLALPPGLTPDALLFGTIQEGSVSVPLTLSATRPAGDPLTMQITGSQFNLVSGTSCASSAVSCPISVIFSPTATGPLSGSLTVTDITTGLFSTATLAGVGTPVPEPRISFSAPGIAATPTALGSTTVTQPVTLTNTGTAALTISSVIPTGPNASDFSQMNSCVGSIAVSATCTLSVSFTPLALGVRAAVLQLVTNAASTPATLQLSGTGTQDPATILIPGANAYIPFTEGAGSAARDLTGNGNHCTFGTGANTPYWTKNGLQLNDDTDASPKFCAFPASSTNADLSVMNSRTLTMCAYFNPQTIPFGYNYTSAFGGSSRDDIAALWLSGPAHGRAAYYMGDYFGQGGEPTWSTQPLVGYRCVTYALGSATDGTLDHFYIDGAEVTSYGAQGTIWDRRMPGDFYQVGAVPWNGGAFLWGTVYTVLTYPTQLTAASVAHNFTVLQQSAFFSRGVGALPVQSTTTSNVLVVDGDSITNDSPYGVVPYPFLLTTNTPFTITDTGVSGKTVESTVADSPLIDLPLYSSNSKYAFISDSAGINDINVGGSTQAQIIADRALLYASYKQTGFTVLAPTMLSSINDDSEVENINAGIRALAATSGYYLVDWANEPCLGAAGAFANPPGCSFFVDGLHLNQAGESEMAALYSNIVNYLTGSVQSQPTVVTASAYVLAPADRFLSAQGASSQTISLPACYGWSTTTPFQITNARPGGSLFLAPASGFTLNGATTAIPIPETTSVTVYAELLSASNSGCGWFTK